MNLNLLHLKNIMGFMKEFELKPQKKGLLNDAGRKFGLLALASMLIYAPMETHNQIQDSHLENFPMTGEESSTIEEKPWNLKLDMLRTYLENLIKGRNAGFFMEIISPNRERSRIGINEEAQFPVASAFKAFVLGAYLNIVPQEKWKIDKGTDVYNMIVYSHNRATGNVIHDIAQHLRNNAKYNPSRNDIELFNDYLESLGLPRVLYSWGFNSPIEGMIDRNGGNTVLARGATLRQINAISMKDLAKGYEVFLHAEQTKSELFRYMLSLVDYRYLSPLEEQFPYFFGKDGYLEPSSFYSDSRPLGSTRIDAGAFFLQDGSLAILSMATFDESEVILPQIAHMVIQHFPVNTLSPMGYSQETLNTIREKLRYRYTNILEIDRQGPIIPSSDEISLLEDGMHSINMRSLGGIITVNLFTGETAVIRLTNNAPTIEHAFLALVGERLPYGNPEYSLRFARSLYGSTGAFDSDHGILYTEFETARLIPQHTLTTPFIGIVEGTHQINGFGNLNTERPVPFLVIKQILQNEDGLTLSPLNSEITIHSIPVLPSSDPGYNHYLARRQILSIANRRYASSALSDGYDPYWSHGCVNVLDEYFDEIRRFYQSLREHNQSMIVVLGYPGIPMENLISYPSEYRQDRHPLFGNNLQRSLGTTFSHLSR